MLGLRFFNSSFHKLWGFKRNIPTVILTFFFNPCPQGEWELLLDPPELGCFPLSLNILQILSPPDSPKSTRGRKPGFKCQLCPDSGALTHPCLLSQCLHINDSTWSGVQTILPLPHGIQFLPGPKATQYFIVQTHGRANGQDREMGGRERTMDTLCFS